MLHLHGMGYFHPENRITNRFLEDLDIGTTNEWILERVGIHERRTCLDLAYIRETRNRDVRAAREAASHSHAQMAARAAELAIERAGIEKQQIGLVVSGSSAPDCLCPAEACFISQELGIEAPSFDINSACTSFLSHLHWLSLLDPERAPDFVLTTCVDSLTRTVSYEDRAAAVLFGDAASAAVISLREPGVAGISHVDLDMAPSGADKVHVPWAGHFRQDGRAVQMFAIKRTQQGYEKIREAVAAEGGMARPLHLVGHQANLRVLDRVCKRCDVPPEHHHANVELFGNTGCASAPSVLAQCWDKWSPQDDVAVSVVGGGLSWGRCLVRFGARS